MVNNRNTIIFIFFLLAGFSQHVSAQVLSGGVPYIQNYDKEDYKTSENQHWAVIQNNEGLTFFGNNEGLLIFDGINWELLELPNKSVVRSLAIDSKGVIYVGGKNEFGRLTGNAELGYTYVSLSDSLPKKDKVMEDIWRIYVNKKDDVFFQSFANVVFWNHKTFNVNYPEGKFHLSFFVDDTFYINERNGKGLKVFEEGSLQDMPNAVQFAPFSIYQVLPFSETELLVATRSHGVFFYNKESGEIRESKNWEETNLKLKKEQVFSAIKFDNETYLFGTLKDGLINVKNGKIDQILNKELGLIDNTIWSLFLDRNKNLIIALDNGISYVSLNSPVKLFNNASGVDKGVLAIEKFNNKIYLGTIDGILSNAVASNKFAEIGENNGFIWQLITIDSMLYATSFNGLLKRTKTGEFNRVGPPEFVWKVLPLKHHPHKVIAGTRDGGLLLFERTTEGLVYLNKIKGFNSSSRWFVEDNQGKIWVSHYNSGVARLTLSEDGKLIENINSFNKTDGLPSNTNNYVFKSKLFGKKQGVIIGTEDGMYQFNELGKNFSKIELLEKLNAGKYINQYEEFDGNKIVFQNGDLIGLVTVNNDSSVSILTKPFTFFSSDFCDIIKPISNNELFFGTTKGVYYYRSKEDNKSAQIPFNLVFRKLKLGDLNLESTKGEVEVPFEHNSFITEFALPFYTNNDKTQYQYQLTGFDNEWSPWSFSRFKEYTSLTEGSYKFTVRAKNIDKEISAIKTFEFTIKPPIYRTVFAYILYITIGMLFVWLIVIYNLKRVKKEKELLQLIVEERTSELSAQNEKLKVLHEEKDHILSIVTHDLRSPFQQIKGLLQLLTIDNNLNEEQSKISGKINSVIGQGNDLISDLLDVASVQQDKELSIDSIDLDQLINDLTTQFSQLASQKKQNIIVNISEGLPKLNSDRLLIWRLLENLLSNAVKFSPIGKKIMVDVSHSNKLFIFSIKDEGPGFTKEDQELMFHKFQKLSARPTNDESSTGLGLSIVKIITDKLGATMEVKTELGKGTEFIIVLKNGAINSKID